MNKELQKLELMNEKQKRHIELLELRLSVLKEQYDRLETNYDGMLSRYLSTIKKLSVNEQSGSVALDGLLNDIADCQIIDLSEGDIGEINFGEMGIKW